jgi:hypothetical protein
VVEGVGCLRLQGAQSEDFTIHLTCSLLSFDDDGGHRREERREKREDREKTKADDVII